MSISFIGHWLNLRVCVCVCACVRTCTYLCHLAVLQTAFVAGQAGIRSRQAELWPPEPVREPSPKAKACGHARDFDLIEDSSSCENWLHL